MGRPFHSAFGEDAYPSLPEKASALFHSLVGNHPFHDGNKRTAVIALHHFLIANGSLLLLGNEEAYQLAIRTAAYREHEASHAEILQEIHAALETRSIFFVDLRQASEGPPVDPYLKQILSEVSALRRKIRRARSNRLLPA